MKIQYVCFRQVRLITVGLCMISLMPALSQAQNKSKGKVKIETFHSVVVDEKGKPIPNAEITVGEGMQHLETDVSGSFSFEAEALDYVTISQKGYDTKVILAKDLRREGKIALNTPKLFMSEKDRVNLPFTEIAKRNFPEDVRLITSEELEKYPSTDFRNALTGLIPGLEVVENYGTTGMSAEESLGRDGVREKLTLRVRGLSPMYIIDDVPTSITEVQLVPGEIESVTLLKGVVAKMMFGPQAANGALCIKTKRGKKNERNLVADLEYGISHTDRFPEFVSGVDYAKLNNMARENDGMTPLYDETAIAGYAQNDPYNMKYPNIDYRNMIFRSTKPITRINLSSNGGNDVVQYFANLSYNGDGDTYKIGYDAGYNRLSARANLDVKVNDLLKVQLDLYGGLTELSSPTVYTGDSRLYEIDNIMNDITRFSPIAFPVYIKNDESLSKPWYGVTSVFGRNPIGELENGGYYKESGRQGNAVLALLYDLRKFVPGLRSKTWVGFQTYNQVRLGKDETYTKYIFDPTLSPDEMIKKEDGTDLSSESKLGDYYYQRFGFYQKFSYGKSFGRNDLQADLTYNISKATIQGIKEPRRYMNTILNTTYTYDNKYGAQLVLNESGTYSFTKSNRYYLSRALGLSWVMSEERFMKSLKFINYLKLYAQAGILAYDQNLDPSLRRSYWTYGTGGGKFGPAIDKWMGGNEDKDGYITTISRAGNPDLTWEKRKEFSVGTEMLLLDKHLMLGATYYNNVRDGIIVQVSNSTPYLSGMADAVPYQNYNRYRYYGVETALQYSNEIGAFSYSVGGSATVQDSKILKYDDPNYRESEAYLKNVGRPVDALSGLVCLGKFKDEADIAQSPKQLFSPDLKPGDFKYADLNNDGVIDNNDARQIGHTLPRVFYSLNVNLKYKNFELYVSGTGRAGFDIAQTNRYFWYDGGDYTYSKYVLDHAGKDYPRLTYNRVANNFQTSTAWLKSGNYFKVQNVELAYTLPTRVVGGIARSVRFYVRGANLLTISKIKEVDPENINSGIYSAPLFKTYTIGAKVTF